MSAGTLDIYGERVASSKPMGVYGKIVDVVGLTLVATGPPMKVGDLCYVQAPESTERVPVEVVGFRGDQILLMPLGEVHGIAPKSLLIPTHAPLSISIGPDVLGRVLDGLGQPIDNGPALLGGTKINLMAPAPKPYERERILEPLATGVRAIDGCLTCGRGQRVAILSGSGVGKSKLLGMIARNTDADINVIALIGERGREVRDFIEVDLGEEGLARSVVIAATSDQPGLARLKGAYLATAIAEWYRSQGKNVLMMMDSVTRVAMAQREIGLAIGEPPTSKAYPPSVFSLLPKLLERAGNTKEGSITGFYSVLVEGDDLQDPIGDAVRSVVDGHVSLSRDLVSRGHYPAIDILSSVSRNMIDVAPEVHIQLGQRLRQMMATHRDAEDLINIGAYVQGTNSEIDQAIRLMPHIRSFLKQGLFESFQMDAIVPGLQKTLA